MIAYYASWSDHGEFGGKGEIWVFEEQEAEAIEKLSDWLIELYKKFDPVSSVLDNLWSASSIEELADNKENGSFEGELKTKVFKVYNQKRSKIEESRNNAQFEIQKQQDYETYLRLKERFENDMS